MERDDSIYTEVCQRDGHHYVNLAGTVACDRCGDRLAIE